MTDHYTYRVTWSPEDGEFIGLCAEFPSLSWLADSQEGAFYGIQELVSDCVADMQSNNEPVPKALADRPYSGKFMVRVPPEIHRALTIQAAEAGVSLNRLVSARLALGANPAPTRRRERRPESTLPLTVAEPTGPQKRQAFVGFRAAWTRKGGGAVCCVVIQEGKVVWTDMRGGASFDDVAEIIERLRGECDDVLVAIDKPILPSKRVGIRPVERVADSFMRQLNSRMSIAYRTTANEWGGLAAIQGFICNVDPCLDFEHAKSAGGCDNPVHLIEVYPDLALPALEPTFMKPRFIEERQTFDRWLARYSPARAHFNRADRELVCAAIRSHAAEIGLGELSDRAMEFVSLLNPRKPDHEIVDAAICLLIALQWRYRRQEYGMQVIGDLETGYMVTPTSDETLESLHRPF